MTTRPYDWIALAVVTQPHGVKGQVKIKSFSDPADGFADYPELTDARGNPVKLRLGGVAQGLFIASIAGLTDRNEAEKWRGRELGIPRSALKEIRDPDRFYIADLVGLTVVDTQGNSLGTVKAVENFGAGDLLEIGWAQGGSDYYTFTEANFPALDLEAGRITFIAPDILGTRHEEEGGDA